MLSFNFFVDIVNCFYAKTIGKAEREFFFSVLELPAKVS